MIKWLRSTWWRVIGATSDKTCTVIIVPEDSMLLNHREYCDGYQIEMFSSMDDAVLALGKKISPGKYHVFKYDKHVCLEVVTSIKEDC